MPGCPGIPSTAVAGDTIGSVDVLAGYPIPTLFITGGYPSSNQMVSYNDLAIDMNGGTLGGTLETDGACSCCCLSPVGEGPNIVHMTQDGLGYGTKPTRDYYPGGVLGTYMDMGTSPAKTYKFHVGQKDPCGKIRGGLYSFRPQDDAKCVKQTYTITGVSPITWGWVTTSTHWCMDIGYTKPAMKYGLFNTSSVGDIYTIDGTHRVKVIQNPQHGYDYISLCIQCGGIDGTTCVNSCTNPMDYGSNSPTQPTSGPGYTVTPWVVGGLFETENCDTDPCTPNAVGYGPPTTGPGPSACLGNNSPLTNTPSDNVCYDCENKSIYHPCYDSTNTEKAPNDGTNINPPVRDCTNIRVGMSDATGTPILGAASYDDNTEPLLNEPAFQNTVSGGWDGCCTYDYMGCIVTEPSYANFNPLASNSNGKDCGGRPNPNNEYRYYDTGTSTFMCQNVPWLAVSETYYQNIDQQIVNGVLVTTNGPLLTGTNPVVDTPCSSLNSADGNGGGFDHPLSWEMTHGQLSDDGCCSNMGCLDNGSYGTQWDDTVSPPPPTVPPSGPGFMGVDSYYPGYSVHIAPSQILLTNTPTQASNYSSQFVFDCNNDITGTFNVGWASCCEYNIPGCTDASPGPNPDIFGQNPGTYLMWNYNPYATVNDGSCFDEEPILGCMDDGGLNAGGVWSNPTYPTLGIPANNFDPTYNIHDLSLCTYTSGCPDPLATVVSYEPCADINVYLTLPPGSCPNGNPNTPGDYPMVPDMSLCDYDIPGAGPGCTDPQALNYNPLATEDCNSIPGDFSCCSYPVEGCTDPNATNYDPLAINDDGSCEYDISTTQEGVNWLYGSKVLLCRDPLTKEEVLMGVCDQPEIQSEIFIERGKQSVIEPNLRLGEIKTMGGLVNHGYKYFRIKKQ